MYFLSINKYKSVVFYILQATASATATSQYAASSAASHEPTWYAWWTPGGSALYDPPTDPSAAARKTQTVTTRTEVYGNAKTTSKSGMI